MSESGGTSAELTMERARVAAMVAAALAAWSALPRDTSLEAAERPAIELLLGQSCWVSVNRARALQPWQPRRPRSR